MDISFNVVWCTSAVDGRRDTVGVIQPQCDYLRFSKKEAFLILLLERSDSSLTSLVFCCCCCC